VKVYILVLVHLLLLCVALRPNSGHGLLILEVFYITHDAPQSLGLLWTSDQPVAETPTRQHTTLTTDKIHAPSGIRTHDPSRRAAAELRHRLRGYWDWHLAILTHRISCVLRHLILIAMNATLRSSGLRNSCTHRSQISMMTPVFLAVSTRVFLSVSTKCVKSTSNMTPCASSQFFRTNYSARKPPLAAIRIQYEPLTAPLRKTSAKYTNK
jgi:hypothetical protein